MRSLVNTLSILRVNLHQLLVQKRKLPEEMQRRLKGIMEALLDNEWEGSAAEAGRPGVEANVAVVKAAVEVFVTGLDLFCPGEEQQALLTNYLRQYTEGSLSPGERTILNLVSPPNSSARACNRLPSRSAFTTLSSSLDCVFVRRLLPTFVPRVRCLRSAVQMLARTSDFEYLGMLLKGSSVEQLLTTLFDIALAASVDSLQALGSGAEAHVASLDATPTLVSLLEFVLSQSTSTLTELASKPAAAGDAAGMPSIMETVFRGLGTRCKALLEVGLKLNAALSSDPAVLAPSVDRVLQQTMVGKVLPLFLRSVVLCWRC